MNEDDILSDYVDGRLARAERLSLEKRLTSEPALARRLRLLKAMKATLAACAPVMPADLKASLKRQARERAAATESSAWRDLWRSMIPRRRWTYGAGAAAFAAAVVMFSLRLAGTGARGGRGAAGTSARPLWSDARTAQELEGLWSEDDGGDDNEG